MSACTSSSRSSAISLAKRSRNPSVRVPSASTATTFPACLRSALVSMPFPGPTSSTVSAGPPPATNTIRSAIRGCIKKCTPSRAPRIRGADARGSLRADVAISFFTIPNRKDNDDVGLYLENDTPISDTKYPQSAQRVAQRLAETLGIDYELRLDCHTYAGEDGGVKSNRLILRSLCKANRVRDHVLRRFSTRPQNSSEDMSFPGLAAIASPMRERYRSSSSEISSIASRNIRAATVARGLFSRLARAVSSRAMSGVSVTKIRSFVVAIYQKCITSPMKPQWVR